MTSMPAGEIQRVADTPSKAGNRPGEGRERRSPPIACTAALGLWIANGRLGARRCAACSNPIGKVVSLRAGVLFAVFAGYVSDKRGYSWPYTRHSFGITMAVRVLRPAGGREC